jgi:glycosyltransferase involved in cell wall biosynthesis
MTALPEPIHVCLLTGEYPPMRGGVGDYTALVARALAGQGARCSVITDRAARTAASDRAPLAPAVYPAIGDWGWPGWSQLVGLVDDLRPDVLHIQYQTGAFGMRPALNLLPLRLRLAGLRVPIALTYHDLKEPYLFPKAGPVRGLANAVLQSAASAVIVTNVDDLVRVVARPGRVGPPPWPDRSRRRKVDLIPIGSNIAPVELSPGGRVRARAALGLEPDELAVGYFGFVDPWKGVERLTEAAQRLLERGRRLRLVFVGGARAEGASAYEAALLDRIEPTALAGRVVRTGYGSPAETSTHLQALDCIALPFEAGGCYRHGTLAAAIAHHLPIVTTRPAIDELGLALPMPPLEHGRNALLVERGGDAAELAEALAALADSPELRARLAAGAAALAVHFGWERIARASLGVYDRILGERRALHSAV